MPMNETQRRTLEHIVAESGKYPLEAFEFVRHGLSHTVVHTHGEVKARHAGPECHVSGAQLCRGLRNYAIGRYGLMAGAVLRHFNIRRTVDFGRIVFAMVEGKIMQKTEEDDIRDFEDVFDFATAFEPPVRPITASKPIFTL